MQQTLLRADPEASIRGGGKRRNVFTSELRALRRLPRQEPGPIKVEKSKFGAHPQIAIRSLGQGEDARLGTSVLAGPSPGGRFDCVIGPGPPRRGAPTLIAKQ